MRRSLFTVGVVTIAVGAAAAGVVVGSGRDPETPVDDDDAIGAESSSLEFAPVRRRDLVRTEELDGTVEHPEVRTDFGQIQPIETFQVRVTDGWVEIGLTGTLAPAGSVA